MSTCGTALLTNGADVQLRRRLTAMANRRRDELSESDRELVDSRLAEQAQALGRGDIATARRLSAELNGLAAYYGGDLPQHDKKDMSLLLHSDTYQGRGVAGALADWMGARGLLVDRHTFAGLSTASFDDFQGAMSEAVRWAEETLSDYRAKGWNVVFNLTGGFKSVNGFLQALAMFHADETVYLFESGSQLLRIPRLPLAMDPEGAVRRNLQTFRRLGCIGELPRGECAAIPETLLLVVDERASLSRWGELVWSQCRNTLYSEGLLDPVIERILYSTSFRGSTAGLPDNRLSDLNRRIDDLARHLVSGSTRGAPESLGFKKLKGSPRKAKGSTHEFYAWSDGDARRVYCHFEDGVLVLDRLGAHL